MKAERGNGKKLPLCKGTGARIATTSDIGHWFRNDWVFQGVRYKSVGADDSVRPVHSFFPFRGDPHKKSPLL